MSKRQSRADRWNEAASDARAALDALREQMDTLVAAMATLVEVQGEYSDWLDNLPDSLRDSPVGEKLQAVVGLSLDLDESSSLEEFESAIDEAEGADLPLGWGRD